MASRIVPNNTEFPITLRIIMDKNLDSLIRKNNNMRRE